MKYNIHVLARIYLKGYYKFLTKYTKVSNSQDAFSLFSYSLKRLYDLEATEYSKSIRLYGDDCISYLSKLRNTPKNPKNLSLEDRLGLVGYAEACAVALDVLSASAIRNGRIEEVVKYNEREVVLNENN